MPGYLLTNVFSFVVYGDKDESEVEEGYIRALTGFIEERLAGCC